MKRSLKHSNNRDTVSYTSTKAVYTSIGPIMQSEKELMVVIPCAAWKWNQTFTFMFILKGRSRPWKKGHILLVDTVLKIFSQKFWTIKKKHACRDRIWTFLNMGEMFWFPMATGSIMIWVSLISKKSKQIFRGL